MERPSDAAVAVRAGRILHLFLWDLRRPKTGARSPYISLIFHVVDDRVDACPLQDFKVSALLPSEDAK